MASFKLIIIDRWCTKVPLHWKMYSEVCFLDNVTPRFCCNLSYFCMLDNVTLRFCFNKSPFDRNLIWLMKCQWWWCRNMMSVFTIHVPGQLCSKVIEPSWNFPLLIFTARDHNFSLWFCLPSAIDFQKESALQIEHL
jgi:hypothetical protein